MACTLLSAKHTFGIAVSPDPSSLSTWKGRDQTTLTDNDIDTLIKITTNDEDEVNISKIIIVE